VECEVATQRWREDVMPCGLFCLSILLCLEFGLFRRWIVDTPFDFAQLQLVFPLRSHRHGRRQEHPGAALAAGSWIDFASPTTDSRFGAVMNLLKMGRSVTAWTSR
jgi:hypothetical protein